MFSFSRPSSVRTIHCLLRNITTKSTTTRLVLGIETSCDDTGVAVVDNHGNVIYEGLSSQFLTHAPHGGIVPQLAQRDHQINLPLLLDSAADAIGTKYSVAADVTSLLSEGKLDKDLRPMLGQFITALEEE